MREVTERRLAVGGLGINLVDFGGTNVPAVLFVHGSFGHARVWDFVVGALPPERRALAIDLPGHGNSDHAPGPASYRFGALATVVREAAAAIGGPLVLAGHSIGSAVAMQYAAMYAGTLAGVVFMDIDPCPPQRQADHLNETGKAPPKRYESFERALARESRVAPAASADVHKHLALHGYREEGGELVQKFDQGFLEAVRTWDLRPALPGITVPALVLRGAESTVMSEEGYADMLAGLPQATGELVAGATHQLHLDHPAAVAAAIERFVAGLG